MIDPVREAQRLVSSVSEDSGFLIFLGLGGAFAPEAALENSKAQIIIIDFGKDDIKYLLANKNYSKLLQNDRVTLLIDPDNNELRNFILEQYKPALHGGIKTIPLRSRVETEPQLFENVVLNIQQALEIVTSDYSVQAFFGKRWFSNIIRNIKTIENKNILSYQTIFSSDKNKQGIKKAAIVAAGPSLDQQLSCLAELQQNNTFVITSDTALPALLYNNIIPDAVVSIDCQHISYYHFLTANSSKYLKNKKRISLILDIASPPMLSRLDSFIPLFFSSAHPLAGYICGAYYPLPYLDTSGANVTYACLSLAEFLGAENIKLFGADFSYIGCKTYVRGSYIYPFFDKKQNRIHSIESQHSHFLYRSPFLEPEYSESSFSETASLRFYRKKLEEKVSVMKADIQNIQGQGAPVNINKNNRDKQQAQKPTCKSLQNPLLQNPITQTMSDNFLTSYRDDINNLPIAGKDNYFNQLNEKEKHIFTTILPYAAALRKRLGLTNNNLIEEVKRQCINDIDKILAP